MKHILSSKSLLENNNNLDNNCYYLEKLVYHKDFKDNLVIPMG